MASGATCVQRLDGSRDSAIHTKYRISLRSSSMREPRYPLPRVVVFVKAGATPRSGRTGRGEARDTFLFLGAFHAGVSLLCRERPRGADPRVCYNMFAGRSAGAGFDNDPSAGSPTETLLRLLLPLNDKVQWTSRDVAGGEPPTSARSEHFTGPFNR